MQPASRPDPGTIFDSLMERKSFIPHPNNISSVLFYVASIIIHDCFRTSRSDQAINETSSYLDLSPLYGSNQNEQSQMRTFEDGMIKPDCFSSKRVLGFPPGCGALLIMFNRFHNYVVENLKIIDENGRFSKLLRQGADKYDQALFQTGRLVTCGLYINIILKDYVGTILGTNRTDTSWSLDPRADLGKDISELGAREAGGNQVSAEFNLIYRWHSCVSERDTEWTEEAYKNFFPDQDISRLGTEDLVRLLGRWESSLSEDPTRRPFAGLARGPDTKYADNDLARLWSDSVKDTAGAFGAHNVPRVLRLVEMLGVEQSRAWNLCTLNELRKFFYLAPHKTFEAINPDPSVSEQLKHLYDHPDLVELYPGVAVEATKKPMAPGSGLCANFTTTRAILSDATSLVRSDRFYTVDYNPKNLTNWGYSEANYDLTVNHGYVFYKLILRALPNNFQPDSIYAHFPLTTPLENHKIMTDLGKVEQYNWDEPKPIARPLFITSYSACKEIVMNQKSFRVTWGESIKSLVHQSGRSYGQDFMLSGDEPANHKARQQFEPCMYHKNWEIQVKKFYEETTIDLLKKHSYQVAGIRQVDIVRDVINVANARFAAAMFAYPLKSEDNPRGLYTEAELYSLMALNFAFIFYDVDPAKSFPLRQAAHTLTQQLGKVFELQVEAIAHGGGLAAFLEKFHKRGALPQLPDYGVHMILALLKQGIKPKDLVWTHVLPFSGGSVANQGQLFSQCLDYYLSDAGKVHLPDINRLAKLHTSEAEDKLLHYFLEGSRISNAVALFRDVAEPGDVEDHGKKIHLKVGDRVVCDLVTASMDPAAFPDPEKVVLDRPMDTYIQFSLGPHGCIGKEWCLAALTTMLRVIGRLDNLRRAPGPQGQVKTIPQPFGLKAYMTSDGSSFSPFPASMKIQWDGAILETGRA